MFPLMNLILNLLDIIMCLLKYIPINVKKNYYGAQGCVNRLIVPSDRWQFVDNRHKSTYLPTKFRVPFLLLIYIHDLPLVSDVFPMSMYAILYTAILIEI